MVVTIMNRTDLSAASILSSTPRFLSSQQLFSALPASIPVHRPLFRSPLLDRTFADLRRLSKIKAANKFSISETPYIPVYSDHVYHLHTTLFLLSNSMSNITQVDKCCCLAAIIYIQSELCDMSFESRALEIVVDTLFTISKQLTTLETQRALSHQHFGYHKALWFLTVGYIASEGKPYRESFVKTLRTVCSWTGCQFVPAQKGLFENILWQSTWNSSISQLWDDVGTLIA
jgi:hypothetical protein